ncbi:hypothetical protein QJS10_CPB12g01081 [Acorus calamus]|uniref:RRM domain-containing protein n=1 Tax=Acorus calamus TaxID=4465 RepID=A0AAV9DLW0_ACOCL|nr:hypothetical protein QJS10_CPB12g01081 [Acorus calamus]
MDPSNKKRKSDENGISSAAFDGVFPDLTKDDITKIIDPFTRDQLADIVSSVATRSPDLLSAIRSIADRDTTQRKLFIRGLGWDTTTDGLRSLFSAYGDLDEAVVIMDKSTGKSKGYGFITFHHIDGALLALKEPSKKIDGRMTVTQLAAAGNTAGGPPTAAAAAAASVDASQRKIYVANVPQDMPADRLLSHFSSYGEIAEGPLGFDKQTGKSRGFALFVYKTVEGARASLVDPVKMIDNHQLLCKFANDGKKGKPGQAPTDGSGAAAAAAAPAQVPGADGHGLNQPGSLSGQYGGPGGMSGMSSFGGLSGMPAGIGHHHQFNSPLQSSLGGPALSAVGGQGPSSLGGYGGGLGGPYGSIGGGTYGGPATGGGYGGLGVGSGVGSSLYRLPPGSAGMPTGGFPETAGHYGLGSSAYQSQNHLQQSGSSPVGGPRVPSGGMYQGMPPYY